MPILRAQWYRLTAVALLSALTVPLAGCTTTISGSAVPDSAALKLDTGNFPTAPRTIEAVAPADAWQQEGFIMADSVVAPFDIRPDLATASTDITTLSQPIIHLGQLFDSRTKSTQDGFLTRETALKLQGVTFQAGFLAAAADKRTDTTVHLSTGLLRFYDDRSAERALDIMHEGAATVPAAIAGVAGAVVVADYPTFGRTRFAAATRVGNLLAVASATTRTAADGPPLVANALRAQVGKAPSYKQNAPLGRFQDIPMDRDGIMSRTLSSSLNTSSAFGLSPRVYFMDGYRSARTQYMITLDRAWHDNATENGVDLIAWTSQTQVFRAKDHRSAFAFSNSASPDTPPPDTTESGAQRIPGIPGNQNTCVEITTGTGCFVVVGRYTAIAVNSTLDLSRQAAAALYLINKAAGEN